ncbi:hypothetical protein CVD28_00855 [Bacillus sp. M6-12]|uniref:hypothetical protein n=1 Tax=Bacillus sp. M6-12 TaxID=2054166 RepID=UPI000C75C165|nr:hypothetical protein [Bacillus sp. M6-12]PLS18983.1 hypothetical protein CVD28_00855 [Bacillus sp. M6-12]
MSKAMKMELICNGELVNKHSDGGKWGWSNPLDMLPPVGSIIEYMTFNQNHKEGQGVLTKYVVKGFTFTTEEDFNRLYGNKVVKINVEKMIE